NGSLVRQELARNDLLLAASYGFHSLTSDQIARFLSDAYRVSSAKPHQVHQLLMMLPPKSFVTTNHDRLLEAAISMWRSDEPPYNSVTNRQPLEIANIARARATRFVFKPHGDVSDLESIILTKE